MTWFITALVLVIVTAASGIVAPRPPGAHTPWWGRVAWERLLELSTWRTLLSMRDVQFVLLFALMILIG